MPCSIIKDTVQILLYRIPGVLAEELSKADSIPEALQQYQARRKPITDLYQKISRKPPQPGADTVSRDSGENGDGKILKEVFTNAITS